MGVKKNCIEGAGIGLFTTNGFTPDEIITYFAPKKGKDAPKSKTYTIQHFGFYFSISENAPLFMGAHFMNDATWECKDADRESLMKDNNAKLNVFTIKDKYSSESGMEIKMTYDGED